MTRPQTCNRALAAILLAVVVARPATAQTAPARVRMATALPEGTAAHDAWKALEPAWRQATGGASELRIYGGGAADDDMLKRLRADQIQAALLTLDGASRLDAGFGVLRTPLLARTPQELDAVLAALAPVLGKRLEAQGYTLLGFAPVGWLRIFSSRPLRTVKELQSVVIADWSADAAAAAWWKERGYAFIATPLADVAAALAAGRATAVPATAPLALALDWYRAASHLLDVPVAPALGVAVIRTPAWQALGGEAQRRLRAAVAAVEAAVAAATPGEEAKAIAEMEKRGLAVSRGSAAESTAWTAEAARLQTAARGALVDGELLDLAAAARDRVRAAHP